MEARVETPIGSTVWFPRAFLLLAILNEPLPRGRLASDAKGLTLAYRLGQASVNSKMLRPTENPGAEEHDRLGKCRQDISIDCRRSVIAFPTENEG